MQLARPLQTMTTCYTRTHRALTHTHAYRAYTRRDRVPEHTPIHTHTSIHTRRLVHTYILSQTRAHTPILSHTRARTHTLSHTHIHARAHAQTRTQTQLHATRAYARLPRNSVCQGGKIKKRGKKRRRRTGDHVEVCLSQVCW